jgi:DNA-binding SARP family transcriptional activator
MEPSLCDRAASTIDGAPRIIVVSAPPGYDKSGFFRACAATGRSLIVADLTGGEASELARCVLDALVAGDRARASRSVAVRLAQRPEQASAAARTALRAEWSLPCSPELFVLRDATGALASPGGVEFLGELVAALPTERILGISTPAPLPPALEQIVARVPHAALGAGDLALTDAAVAALARDAGVPADTARALYDLTRGWPLVSRLLMRLAADDPEKMLREAVRAQAAHALLAFAAHRTIVRLEPIVREALVVAALLRGGAQADFVRVLGDGFDDVQFAELVRLPVVHRDGERVFVDPEIAALLRSRFKTLWNELYDRTLHVLSGDGAYAKAAEVALDGGDTVRAAAILDAVPPYTTANVPLADYERILDRLDRDLVTQYPNVWLATIPYRAYAANRGAYVREAETIYYCLPRSAAPHVRAVVLMHLASGYANVDRGAESEQLLRDALDGFARDDRATRAMLLRFVATLRGIEGRFTEARALAAEADATAADSSFGENQTLHYIDGHEAAYRGRYERAAVIFDELTRRMARANLPLYVANAATNGAFIAWVSGDDERFRRDLAVLEEALTPGIERGFTPMIDAARGRALQLDENHPWAVTAAIAQLYRLGEAQTEDDALDAAREAVRHADMRRDPYIQIIAHVALYVLDPTARAAEAATLTAIVDKIEGIEVQSAVRELIAGRPAGILEPLVRKRILREREHREPRLSIELLAGSVTRDGIPVKLSDKELELLVFLALAQSVVTRDRIGQALWDHIEPDEWPNNLKVTLSRMKAKLDVREAIVATKGGYRLAPTIDVDLRRAEAVLRECGSVPLDERIRDALRAIISSYVTGAPARFQRVEWMQSSVARINDVVCTAGLVLARDALHGGRYDDALGYARTVFDVDPFNEAACELTIRIALARRDADAARREFQRYAGVLASELGAAPSQALAELVRAPA